VVRQIPHHLLVAVGAAAFVAVPQQSGASATDVTRVIQGLVAGIGFLDAGCIWRDDTEGRVEGLTAAVGAAAGFVNFRVRAMAVSFAGHALHPDWRTIHPHLARVFRDYEPGIHLSQLQMQAGVVGINTIRVYNPTKQLTDHDAKAVFVKRWVPELRAAEIPAIREHVATPLPGYAPAVVDFEARTAATKEVLYGLRKTHSPADTAEVYRRHGSRKKAAMRKGPKPKPPPKRRKERADQPGLFDGIGVE